MDENFANQLRFVVDQSRNYPDKEAISFLGAVLYNLEGTHSQNFQDIWALYESEFKKNGTFVEFGATNGVDGSNTYLLEKRYGWSGILAEPLPIHTSSLHTQRPTARIVPKCVWTKSADSIDFLCTDEQDLSTIAGYGGADEHSEKRLRGGNIIQVETISLYDLLSLKPYTYIDYMSVDTEGSEFDILQAFFQNPKSRKYFIHTLSVEHNFNQEARQKLFDLLSSNGYVRKFEVISRWDDFYVRKD